jgi:hypothetical protein
MRNVAMGLSAALLVSAAQAAPPAAAVDPATDKVLQCMRANIPPTVRIQQFELTSVDRTGGSRTLKGRLYATREGQLARVMLQIEAPSDLAGAAYLVRENKEGTDEIYLYLPATRKVRRITGPSQDGKLWGTDLSFNDVKQLQNAYSGAAPRLQAPGTLDGRPMHVLDMTPRPGDTVRYNKVRAWVDQKTCVAVKVEFSDQGGVRKTIAAKASDLKQSGKYWYLSEADMADVRDNTHTHLKMVDLTSPEKLAERLFNPQTFYLGG